MDTDLIQTILEVTFTKVFPYVLPLVFLFMLILFSERIIDLIYNSIGAARGRRRS